MKTLPILAICLSVLVALGTARGAAPAGAAAPEKNISGTMTINDEKIDLVYAYVDASDADEPIVVLSDKPLPADAIPFIPEKFIKEQKVHAIAFSVSSKDKKLTNTYGMLSNPSEWPQVGLGRVEEGKTTLTVTRLDADVIEGKIATPKPVKLPYISYSFDLSFKAEVDKSRK